MTDLSPPTAEVDHLREELESILVKIRNLQAEVNTLELEDRQSLIAVRSMMQNGIPMTEASKALASIADHTHAISRLKTRIQFLRKFEAKSKGRISVLTVETFAEVYDGDAVDALAEEKAAVAGFKGPLLA